MRITRVYADAEGVTHFDDLEILLKDAGTIGCLSARNPASGIIFRTNTGDYDYDWHPAPERQYVVLLDGAIEIEVGTGEIRQFIGGDVVLLEDTEGRGHRTRSVDRRPRRSLFIPVDPQGVAADQTSDDDMPPGGTRC